MMGVIFFVFFFKNEMPCCHFKNSDTNVAVLLPIEIRANKKPSLKVSRMALDQALLVWSQGGSNP